MPKLHSASDRENSSETYFDICDAADIAQVPMLALQGVGAALDTVDHDGLRHPIDQIKHLTWNCEPFVRLTSLVSGWANIQGYNKLGQLRLNTP